MIGKDGSRGAIVLPGDIPYQPLHEIEPGTFLFTSRSHDKAQETLSAGDVAALAGNYRLPSGSVLGINAFADGTGPLTPLFTDYTTGLVRTLFPLQDGQFGMGPSLGVRVPLERTIRVIRNDAGGITAIGLRRGNEEEIVASRLSLEVREVTFRNGTRRCPARFSFLPHEGRIRRSCCCMARDS